MLFISILICEPPCRAVVRAAQEPVSLSALGAERDSSPWRGFELMQSLSHVLCIITVKRSKDSCGVGVILWCVADSLHCLIKVFTVEGV